MSGANSASAGSELGTPVRHDQRGLSRGADLDIGIDHDRVGHPEGTARIGGGAIRVDAEIADMVLRHHRDRLRLDDGMARQRALVEHHLDEARVVMRRGDETAAAGFEPVRIGEAGTIRALFIDDQRLPSFMTRVGLKRRPEQGAKGCSFDCRCKDTTFLAT